MRSNLLWICPKDVDGPRSTNRTMDFIAHEVEEVIPHVVQEGKNGYKVVAYANMTVLLVQAVKAWQEEIDELKGDSGSVDNRKRQHVCRDLVEITGIQSDKRPVVSLAFLLRVIDVKFPRF